MKYRQTASVCALVLMAGVFASADDKTPAIEWNGYVDVYYQLSPQAHTIASPGPGVVEGRAFDRINNQFTLNMFELSAKRKAGPVSIRLDAAFGEMVDVLSGGGSLAAPNAAANEPTRNITQATLTYAPTESLSVTVGKFYTHQGFEVTKAKDNWQYSRSYTFNYGIPFWHEGLSLNYGVMPGKFSTTVYVLNSWDGRISQKANNALSLGANLTFTPLDGASIIYNYMGGSESADVTSRREVHEVNASYQLSPTLSLAADYILGSQTNVGGFTPKWSGLAFYVKAQVNSWYTISPRYEIFDDSDQGFAISGGLAAQGSKQKITATTLANNFDLGQGLELRLELRMDKSDSKSLFKSGEGVLIDHQESTTLAMMYAF